MRTVREFCQTVPNGLPKLDEVITPGMRMSDLLAQQSPELLDVVEPRGIGWQWKHYQARVFLQCLEYYWMIMVGPIIPSQIDCLGLRVSTGNLANKLGKTLHRNLRAIPSQNLAGGDIQEADHTHQSVGAMAVAHLGLPTAKASPQPTLAGLPIEAGFVLKKQNNITRIQPSFLHGLLQSPFFSAYWRSGL